MTAGTMRRAHVNSQARIFAAFRERVLSQHYESFSVQDVIDDAQVAKSTFYAHFRSKNDLLLQSIEPILSEFAKVCRGQSCEAELVPVLEHVWENRSLGRIFFQPPMSGHLTRALADLVYSYPADEKVAHTELVASAFSVHGLIGTIGEWVIGNVSISASQLARELLFETRKVPFE